MYGVLCWYLLYVGWVVVVEVVVLGGWLCYCCLGLVVVVVDLGDIVYESG